MKDLGLPSYRFSISWSRLLPRGRGEPNPEGVAFYTALIDELCAQGIAPLATIYHWDLPQCLEDEYGGWLSRRIIDDFEHFAATCFAAFGDRVSSWITFNEPWCSTVLGYANGEMAPGHTSAPDREPYLAAHHIILAHARAVRRYRSEFQERQKGRIGITLNMDWKEPRSASAADAAAAQRALDWQLGWYADPIWKGDYPAAMRQSCGERLPAFTDAEKEMVRGTSDFFGLNHYSTDLVSAPEGRAKTTSMWGNEQSGGYFDDLCVENTKDARWGKTDMGWAIVPWGLKHLCEYIQREYSPPGGILITENGCAVREDTAAAARDDAARVQYFQSYLAQVHKAIQGGADVRGYFAWSFMDNFEWALGYSKRFGIVHVDYDTQVRTPKASAMLISGLARANALKVPASLVAASDFAAPVPEGSPAKRGGDSDGAPTAPKSQKLSAPPA